MINHKQKQRVDGTREQKIKIFEKCELFSILKKKKLKFNFKILTKFKKILAAAVVSLPAS